MAKFIIHGGSPLTGEVEIKGMKNAATPIIAATLLTNGVCELNNIPRISDVEKMLEILISLGSDVKWTEPHTLKISNKNLSLKTLDRKKMQTMRSSVLLLGPLLARFGQIEIPEPGGCLIGARPIDTHLYALQHLGARIEKKDSFYQLKAQTLKGNLIILPEFSVTATENLVMAASLAQGRTIVKLAAAEPHVQDLCCFLNKMGAKISGIGTHTLIINGVEKLNGTKHKIIPDQIELAPSP